MSELNPAKERFAQEVASGATQADAYRKAYPKSTKWKQETIHNKASALMRLGEVSARVAELKEALAKKNLWTREMSVKALVEAYQVAKKAGQSAGMTQAVKELNNMHGYNEPAKVDLTTNGESLNRPAAAEIAVNAFKKHNDK